MDRIQKIWLGSLLILLVGCSFLLFTDKNQDMAVEVAAQGEIDSRDSDAALQPIPAGESEITELDAKSSDEDALLIFTDAGEIEPGEDGVSLQEGILVITKTGSYMLQGRLDGTIYVKADEDGVVHLILNGLEVYSAGRPALFVESASKVIVTLKEGSNNAFCDTAYRANGVDADGCIYSVADLTFNGAGALTVQGYFQDAVASKGRIKILEGNYNIWAADDGLRGRDGITIVGGNLQLQTEGCGMKSTNTENEKKGTISIRGGVLTMISGEHAISASRDLVVENCQLLVRTVQEAMSVKGNRWIDEDCLHELGDE